jgi:hypothetical protein
MPAIGNDFIKHCNILFHQDGMDDSGNWQWCLLSISGNKTIVQRRRRDFIHYLRMNIAR